MEKDNQFVLPGQVIFENSEGLMPGNGVVLSNGKIIATVRGFIKIINQLVSVTPMTSIYSPNVGDIVVGRIESIQKQRWRVQIGAAVLADLRLSSIFLPDGELRRRTTTDERNMRQYFDVGDLICAEVQNISGGTSLHTREQHPKKLENGIVVDVPSRLIKRVPNHIVVLAFSGLRFNVVFGLNGSIWISPDTDEAYPLIPRIRNCILLLATYEQLVYSDNVCQVFDKTSEIPIADILTVKTAQILGFVQHDEE
ncbi:exonuclease, putative [Trichomonas vaginalis G3]|uniref:Exonuclease, putative n=1 Tax=Trichomonas vaginalis (strain ATCC PRA-98 / G3) TaxID=412133 RepID=A2DKL3_TRIV3|nr:nuclear retention of pre-mRNA with aberrant 3'-ends at the site of transcription [Trichomonas vaginalis G3]EAY18996.1 exonuclease, putative [Trichomonas vaginalis G3]KAI5521211.1 nuclear retention of pre-mRNA with aberrant 3'-ends at the site of transcription [Trichomonas vaginalis G3]|eukprot:XP_001579982.1 exonuclease [Trichomonas vaginalis G3]